MAFITLKQFVNFSVKFNMVCDRASTSYRTFQVLNLQKSCLRFISILPSVNLGKFGGNMFLFKIDSQSISLAW